MNSLGQDVLDFGFLFCMYAQFFIHSRAHRCLIYSPPTPQIPEKKPSKTILYDEFGAQLFTKVTSSSSQLENLEEMAGIPPCPASLKAIQHYLKVAQEHATRDPVVCYWSELYALQAALKIDRKSDESKIFLARTMDHLEALKKELKDNEAISNEIAAQAHIENYALKLFIWADSQDRASNFGKNVVKAFYTSGMLFDVLTTFGELSEEIQQNRKYAKWKAAYIHNCLKNGETPTPGPIGTDEEDDMIGGTPSTYNDPTSSDILQNEFDLPKVPPSVPDVSPAPSMPAGDPNSSHSSSGMPFQPVPGFDAPSVQLPVIPSPTSLPSMPNPAVASKQEGGVALTPEQMTKAQKYCKWAGSAMNYDDIPTAIMNLEKALHLLKTGIDT